MLNLGWFWSFGWGLSLHIAQKATTDRISRGCGVELISSCFFFPSPLLCVSLARSWTRNNPKASSETNGAEYKSRRARRSFFLVEFFGTVAYKLLRTMKCLSIQRQSVGTGWFWSEVFFIGSLRNSSELNRCRIRFFTRQSLDYARPSSSIDFTLMPTERKHCPFLLVQLD